VIQLNAWNHVAAAYYPSTGTRRIFVDGTQVASRQDAPITITDSSADLAIGALLPAPGAESLGFSGRIDEVQFYNRTVGVADAGPDQSVTVSQSVQLNGSGSTAPNSLPLGYQWQWVDRPEGSTASFSDETSPSPTFVPDVVGQYVAELDVIDYYQTGKLTVPRGSGVPDRVSITAEGASTPAGTDVAASPVDPVTGQTPVVMTFGNVETAGVTTLVSQDPGSAPPLPADFKLGDPAILYNIETTATFSGAIALQFDYSGASFDDASDLRIMHYESDAWVDVTTGIDLANTLVFGQVTSLSPFAVVEPTNRPPVADAGADQSVECASPDGTPVTLDASASSDPDVGDVLTYEWRVNGETIAGPTNESQATATLGDGEHAITLLVTDAAGESAGDDVLINIVDTTPPVVTLGGEAQITLSCHLESYLEPGATVSDNCDADVEVLISGAVDVETVGTYAITYSATDSAGNAADPVTRTVRVVDVTPPVVSLLGDADVTLEAVTESYTEAGATATDECDPNVSVDINGTVNAAVPGDYLLTYTSTDSSGNASAPVMRSVHVVDTTPPLITAPADLIAEATAPQTGLADIGTATATDLVGVATLTNDAPATYPLGATTVTWTAADGADNSATATQLVEVVDTTAPAITTPPSIAGLEATGPLTAVEVGTGSAIDLVSGVVAVTSSAPDSFVVGTTNVTWTATDEAGNIGTTTQTVEIVDTTPPEIIAQLVSAKSGERDDEEDDGDDEEDDDRGRGRDRDDDDEDRGRRRDRNEDDGDNEDDEEKGRSANSFRVVLSGDDLVDPAPTVHAHITLPTIEETIDVRYERHRRKVEISIQERRRGTRVTLTGPDEDALRVLWADAIERGGFAVEDGQIVKLIDLLQRGRDEDDEDGDDDDNGDEDRGTARFRFDPGLRLTEAHTPNPLMVARATDAAGNVSTIVQVQPPYRWRRAAKLASAPEALRQGAIQAYPNPFNSSTLVAFEVERTGQTTIVVYNAMGQRVRELLREHQVPGFYQVAWDGRDDSGRAVASGVYIYRLTTPSHAANGRMTLLR